VATWTKNKLANMTLEFIGVKPAGQSISGEHVNFVKEAIDSVYDRFQDQDLAPYGVDAIPEWAQWPFVKYMAFEVGPRYGRVYPETLRDSAERDMAKSRFGGPRGELPIKSKDY
jgi:hypothetical protein